MVELLPYKYDDGVYTEFSFSVVSFLLLSKSDQLETMLRDRKRRLL